MTYNEYHKTYSNKAKGYPLNACKRALEDCHYTLTLWGAEISTEYSTRLWAEIDAMRDRIRHLQSKHD
jgi:hypothetical protein